MANGDINVDVVRKGNEAVLRFLSSFVILHTSLDVSTFVFEYEFSP